MGTRREKGRFPCREAPTVMTPSVRSMARIMGTHPPLLITCSMHEQALYMANDMAIGHAYVIPRAEDWICKSMVATPSLQRSYMNVKG